jgi:NTE family protein
MRTLKLGLALGPGGTKGAAHVGVMRVLEDAGLRAEVVAGTSIGALYGGAYAVGRSTEEMEDGIRTTPRRDVISFFGHRLKIRDNNRLARRFYEALAGHHIEDLPVRYAAVASDIERRTAYAITSGPIIDAIEASIAIPLIARPVAHQGRYLLDGGFWDPAPVDAAAALGADVIVSVELGRMFTLPQRLREPAARFARRFESAPLGRTIAGVPFSIHAVSQDPVPGRTAHVAIRPGITRLSGNSPFHMTHCLERGIEAAREALPAIRALIAGEAPEVVAEGLSPAPRFAADPGFA